ncbi:MAG TPA: cache domain-containing protein [Patescibacteria group bacterium]|nr:cache domain-containing protein [Patescibacteria group bacterium]
MPNSSDEKKQIPSKSLAATLMLAFLLVGVLVLIFSISLDTFFNFQTQQNAIIAQQRLIAQQAASEVKSFIEEKAHALRVTTRFTNFIQATEEERNVALQKLLGLDPSFRQLIILDTKGDQLEVASRVSNFALKQAQIKEKTQLLAAVKNDQNYISTVYLDQGTGEPKILIAVPQKDIFGDFIGVVAAEVNLKFMWDLVSNLQVGNEGVAYVVNNQGDLLAYHDTSRVLKGENLKHVREVDEFISLKKTDVIEEINISKGIQNIDVVSTFVPLGNPDWAVVIELPVAEAYAGILEIFKLSILIIIFSSFLAIVSGYYLSKRIIKPLIILTEATEKMSGGDFTQRVAVTANNEIGRLSTVFNVMADKLQGLYTDLEQKVKEKTAELQKEKENVERKVIERTQQLSYEQDRLQASINSLSMGYVMTGPDNKVILINTAAEDILTLNTKTAHPAQRVVDVSQLKGHIDINYIQAALREKVDIIEQIEEAKKRKVTIVLKEIPYKMLFLNIFIAPIISKETFATIGTVMLIDDITEQKVVERSHDEFFSIASHELRTPLTAIRGNSSMIIDYFMKDIQNPEVKEIITDIHESSLRLIDIVNDFLDMSRIEQGKVQYESEPFELVQLCQNVVKEYDVTGSRKKLYLRVDQPVQPLPLVYADKNRSRQALVNLVGNGIKFTEQGGISLSFQQLEHHIKVLVTDTGAGIAEANKNLLFRKFQQAESNILTRDNTKGTGLGLYISKLMMKDMGGDIALEKSELGKGSTFSLIIPIATQSQTKEYQEKMKTTPVEIQEKGGPDE